MINLQSQAPASGRRAVAQLTDSGRLFLEAGNPAQAIALFERAVKLDPGNAEAHHGLAMIAFAAQDVQRALECARKAVHARPREPAYLYTLGRSLRALGQDEEAAKAYRKALAQAPSRVDIRLSLGVALRALGQFESAMECYRQVLAQTPEHWMARHNLANLLSSRGRLAEADLHYEAILSRRADVGEVHLERAHLLRRRGEDESARSAYLLAARCGLHNAANWIAAGESLRVLSEADVALGCLRQAASVEPGNAHAHFALADAQFERGDMDAAIESFARALTIRENSAQGLVNLGLALRERGRREEALACLRRALEIEPGLAVAHLNLGVLLNDYDQHALAAAAFEEALRLDPDIAGAALNLGSARRFLAQYGEALRQTERALVQMPGSPHALVNRALLAVEMGDAPQAVNLYVEALGKMPDYAQGRHNLLMCLNYAEGERVADVLAAHREFDVLHTFGLRRERPVLSAEKTRLRVGYVSSDFRRHSVAYFAEPVLAGHDTTRFEVVCYAANLVEDDVTQRFKQYGHRWVSCANLSDEELAARIRADGIDILVDLSGHTGGNRVMTFARTPAPVQMTWLGYPSSTGLSCMDYRITDVHVDPEGYEAFNSERLLRLAHSYFCYRPPADAPEVGDAPVLRNGFLTFGSFNNMTKLSAAAVELWGRVLNAVPDSRLLFKTKALADDSVRQSVTERFARAGIDAARLDLLGWETATASHLDVYNRVDIALDTWPYNGATTTCESLWMGVPVVSLSGPMQASRMGLSILHAAGLGDWATNGVEQFVETATRWAAAPAEIQALRAGMRGRLRTVPLMNETAFVRDFEAALWRAAQAAMQS